MESIKQLVEKRLARPFIPQGQDAPVRCVVCEDTGFERFLDAQKRLWARRCGCVATRPVLITGCPDEFRGRTLDSVEEHAGNRDVLKAVRSWVPRGRDLYLHGGVGRGKTLLACAAVAEMGKPARFELVDQMLRDLVHQDDDGERWETLRNVPVLILDDIGTADTDWARRALTTLYDSRLARRRRTVFTSNKSLAELVAAFDDQRLGSRIAGAADIHRLEGPDYRKRRSV